MYITLYKNNLATVFTAPAATPSLSNYLQIVEGSRGSLWQCTRTGNAAYWAEVANPGGIIPSCVTCPPTGTASPYSYCTCTIGYQRWYRYIPDTYVYSWTKVQDGYPEIIFGGIIKEIIEDVTIRTYDKDTSKFEGLADEALQDPLIFVLKEDDGTYVYSGYVNSWSQNEKVCRFKGLDFKTILDTEILLDFYADWVGVNLEISTILEKVFDSFDANQPEVIFNVPTISTDTTYIANLLGQVFTTNALKFIKVYLVTAGVFLACSFNEINKKIEIDVTSTDQVATIHLNDFVHESTMTDTNTNKCIATIKPGGDVEDTDLYKWLRSNQEYYDSRAANMKSVETGFTIDANQFIVLTTSDVVVNNISGDYYLEIRINNTNLQKIAAWSSGGTPRYWFWIPYHPDMIYSSRVDRDPNSISRIGVGILNPLSDIIFETQRYSGNPANGKDLYLQDNDYTDFGQGWFEGYINNITLPTDTYIRIRIALKGNPAAGFANSIVQKTIIANPEVIGNRQDFITYLASNIQNQDWYLRPQVVIPDDGTMPYGYAVKTTDGSIDKYWQLGQVPKEPKPVPTRNYYLGKDNEIYEEFISPGNQIFPVKQKIIEEEFFYKAQFNAVYELVNSRFNRNIIVLDNSKVNPLELSNLGLNAQITVYDKLNNVAILPVSEIEIRNGKKSVKLGFKKIFLTEVIKG